MLCDVAITRASVQSEEISAAAWPNRGIDICPQREGQVFLAAAEMPLLSDFALQQQCDLSLRAQDDPSVTPKACNPTDAKVGREKRRHRNTAVTARTAES